MTTSQRLRRPQRQLTYDEHDVVAGVQTLYLHRMRHLGLVDPVPNPSPMSEDEGAWVRAHVWPPFLHQIDDGYAWGFWRWSFCEKGTCWNCLAGRCDGCLHRQKGGPDACDNAEAVHNHRGRTVADLVLRPTASRACGGAAARARRTARLPRGPSAPGPAPSSPRTSLPSKPAPAATDKTPFPECRRGAPRTRCARPPKPSHA